MMWSQRNSPLVIPVVRFNHRVTQIFPLRNPFTNDWLTCCPSPAVTLYMTWTVFAFSDWQRACLRFNAHIFSVDIAIIQCIDYWQNRIKPSYSSASCMQSYIYGLHVLWLRDWRGVLNKLILTIKYETGRDIQCMLSNLILTNLNTKTAWITKKDQIWNFVANA